MTTKEIVKLVMKAPTYTFDGLLEYYPQLKGIIKIANPKEPVHYTCKAKIIKRKGVIRDE